MRRPHNHSRRCLISHIVTINTEVRDTAAIDAACKRLDLAEPTRGSARLFSGETQGVIVNLPGWRYPVVCDVDSGELRFDNYGGQWGEQTQLDRFLQAYAVEKAKLEARKQGHVVAEQSMPDGAIKLTIHV